MENIISSIYGLYNHISKAYYKKYKQFEKEFNELTNNNSSWDFLSHSNKERALYQSLTYQMEEYALITVLFAAFSVEAMINWYGVSVLGEKFFEEHLERLSTIDKLVIVTKIATGKDFPKSNNAFRKVKKLINSRNKLVHSKSKELSSEKIFKMGENEFFDFLSSGLGHCFEIIDEAVTTYDDLFKLLFELNKKQEESAN